MQQYRIMNCPDVELSFTNKAILNPANSSPQIAHIAVRYPRENEAFVFSVISSPLVPEGQIAFNKPGRTWASLYANKTVEAAPYKFEPSQCLNAITFYTDFQDKSTTPNLDLDTEDMAKQFSQQFCNQAFTVGQIFGFAYQLKGRRVVLQLTVKELEAVNIENVGKLNVEIGLTTANTVFIFEKAENSQIRLVGGMTGQVSAPKIFNQNWDFATMGVGGLSKQFNEMFRRAFASRLLPPQFAEKAGFKHVRGILLYGPPGTGKTLIARQIGKMLLAREPKIVNGPEILNKYVGESEANIRLLFKEAEEEQAKAGMNSGLHMIIFDEIDALCKSRGTSSSSSGVGENVVNQLLTKIDGVNSLNNVLLIGMTNRRDLIDEALLRPGRFDLQLEIGLPSKEGRLEIFTIHTKEIREMGIMDSDVSLEELAEAAKNYTGAEIAGVIEAAKSLAISRVIKADSAVAVNLEMLSNIKVTRADFQYAMDHDVKPALGASEAQLKVLASELIKWDKTINEIELNMSRIIEEVSTDEAEQSLPHYVLMVGGPGAGLTTLAANMATRTEFPFIRVYEARTTAGRTESSKVQYLEKLFDDADRSELSCVVIDKLELILDYCHIGPRYSNASRAVLVANKDRRLPADHKMLVICVCNDEQSLRDMRLIDIFNDIIRVPSLTTPEQVETFIRESDDSAFSNQIDELTNALGSIPFKMGIKKLEQLVKKAAKDGENERVRRFIERMHSLQLVIRPSQLDQPFNF